MNIYLAIKYHADLCNKSLIETISEQLEHAGHSVYCIHRDLEGWGVKSFSAQKLMQKSFEAIRSSDLILIEFSEKGVGLGIEAGYAHALEKPIIVMAKTGSDISTTLQGIAARVLFYQKQTGLTQLIQSLEQETIAS